MPFGLSMVNCMFNLIENTRIYKMNDKNCTKNCIWKGGDKNVCMQ